MHISFDLYPSYLRRMEKAIDPSADYQLNFDIHAMRNYEYREEGGKRVGPFPQVRNEGSLDLKCSAASADDELRFIDAKHVRSWSTWTNQDHASKQTIEAHIEYAGNVFEFSRMGFDS